jgi:hypothetical protein
MFRVASISVAVSLSVLSMAAGSASPARDRFIVFSESIGGVRLNMPEAAVRHLYGRPTKVTSKGGEKRLMYVVGKGRLWVQFRRGGRVGDVETSSDSFRTVDGLHVGSFLHDYPCSVLDYYASCDRPLLGFKWDDCNEAWVKKYNGVVNVVLLVPDAEIPDHREPVTNVWIGYPSMAYWLNNC